jgi:hypothetical protein
MVTPPTVVLVETLPPARTSSDGAAVICPPPVSKLTEGLLSSLSSVFSESVL